MATFYDEIQKFDGAWFDSVIEGATVSDVDRVLAKRVIQLEDMPVLLSKAGGECLEKWHNVPIKGAFSILERPLCSTRLFIWQITV